MAKKKKRKAVEKVDWRRMIEVDPLVQELVNKYHRHLERAKIVVLGKPKASKSLGKINVAKAKRATPQIQALVKELAGEDVHYLIEIGLDHWETLDTKTRRIVVDHELCHFLGLDDESGKWTLRGHDVQEFTEIIKRHGTWNVDLELFCRTAQQLELKA